jgi:hypothetical protein
LTRRSRTCGTTVHDREFFYLNNVYHQRHLSDNAFPVPPRPGNEWNGRPSSNAYICGGTDTAKVLESQLGKRSHAYSGRFASTDSMLKQLP